MIHGYSYSSSGLQSRQLSMQLVANNLANLNSVGFKRTVEFDLSMETDPTQHNQEPLYTERIDFSQGELVESGNPLDVAIDGQGFFAVQTTDGVAYTRQGNLRLNEEGYLTTASGHLVLGGRGPIIFPPNGTITDEGAIAVDGKTVDQLVLYDITDKTQVERLGDGLFRPKVNGLVVEVEEPKIRTGYLEGSNVNAIGEMVRMIQIYREFEANQRALKTQDETVEKAVNQVGKVG